MTCLHGAREQADPRPATRQSLPTGMAQAQEGRCVCDLGGVECTEILVQTSGPCQPISPFTPRLFCVSRSYLVGEALQSWSAPRAPTVLTNNANTKPRCSAKSMFYQCPCGDWMAGWSPPVSTHPMPGDLPLLPVKAENPWSVFCCCDRMPEARSLANSRGSSSQLQGLGRRPSC